MIKNIDQNTTKIYPDVKTYIEEKSQIDVKHLLKVLPDEKPENETKDNVELSNNAKNAAQNAAKEQAYVPPEAPKAEKPTPEKTDASSENLDTYF